MSYFFVELKGDLPVLVFLSLCFLSLLTISFTPRTKTIHSPDTVECMRICITLLVSFIASKTELHRTQLIRELHFTTM